MRAPKAAVIFNPGERADGIYIIRSDTVEVQLLNEIETPVWSRAVAENGILGLASAIENHLHHVRAVASDNTEVIFVEAQTLACLITGDPKLGAQALRLIGRELSDLRRRAVMLNTKRTA